MKLIQLVYLRNKISCERGRWWKVNGQWGKRPVNCLSGLIVGVILGRVCHLPARRARLFYNSTPTATVCTSATNVPIAIATARPLRPTPPSRS